MCIILYKCYDPHLLHFIWFGCLRSCTNNPSHEFLATRWFVHNQFVDLDNPLNVLVHYLLIRMMVGFSHRDRVPMVRTLMCTTIPWIVFIVSCDVRLLDCYDFTNLLCFIVSTLREYWAYAKVSSDLDLWMRF